MPRKQKLPGYRLHRPSGLAVVTLAGRDRYLGAHGSAESRQLYDRLLGEWLAAGRPSLAAAGDGCTVAELVQRYLAHAETWYTKDGAATSQLDRIRGALGRVVQADGSTPAARYGPRLLKATREGMISAGWSRGYINQSIGCIKRAFRWGVSEELIPPAVAEGLRAVEGLRAGRCKAKETKRVQPVPEADIEPVLQRCLSVVQDLARLQLLTGARPGEMVQMRPVDVDRSAAVWVYRPQRHKTSHHGSQRPIFIGPKAQAVLTRYLEDRATDAYCFSPREALTARRAELGQAATFSERRPPRSRYTTQSYGRAIRKACDAAGVERWHPHQLRHNAATRIRAEFGADVARAILGHRTLQATQIYAELDMTAAAEAAAKSG